MSEFLLAFSSGVALMAAVIIANPNLPSGRQAAAFLALLYGIAVMAGRFP
jgi:hypothetical protein